MGQQYLRNKSFLKEIDNLQVKEEIVKITLLNFADERPICDIAGIVTAGSLNLNGDSAVRRNGSLTIVIDESYQSVKKYHSLFSLNKKIKIEKGIKNTTSRYQRYDYIWFPLGVFVITSSSITHDTSSMSINLGFEDKMCLLNGNCGGVLPSSVTLDTDDKGNKKYVLDIIYELVNHFGGEDLNKIIVTDVEKNINGIVKWDPLITDSLYLLKSLHSLNGNYFYQYQPYLDTTDLENLELKPNQTIEEYLPGDIIGYKSMPFVCPDELIIEMGRPVTEALDALISMTLGDNYEYFYDVYGNFVFRQIKNYRYETQAAELMYNLGNNDYCFDKVGGEFAYKIENNLVSNYSNTPQYSNIKNDWQIFSIISNENEVSTTYRYHLAIDMKPPVGNEYSFFIIPDGEKKIPIVTKMVEEFNKLPRLTREDDGTYYGVEEDEPFNGEDYEPTALYQWLLDDTTKSFQWKRVENSYYTTITTKDWRTELMLRDMVAAANLGVETSYYYAELSAFWPDVYDVEEQDYYDWVKRDPSSMSYFLDFVEPTNNALQEICIASIGRRTRAEQTDSVNCMFAAEIPNLSFIETGDEHAEEIIAQCKAHGTDYIQVNSEIYEHIILKEAFKSCYSYVRALMTDETSMNEQISLTTTPLYALDVNNRINVSDPITNIYGDYITNTISVPLDASGQMSITATRPIEYI